MHLDKFPVNNNARKEISSQDYWNQINEHIFLILTSTANQVHNISI